MKELRVGGFVPIDDRVVGRRLHDVVVEKYIAAKAAKATIDDGLPRTVRVHVHVNGRYGSRVMRFQACSINGDHVMAYVYKETESITILQ